MSALIEIRTYRARPGMREELMRAMRTAAFPVQEKIGIRLLGPFAHMDDEEAFTWLRAFPDAASREPMTEAFYGGSVWERELEDRLMPMLASYDAVVVVDAAGPDDLWSRWPSR